MVVVFTYTYLDFVTSFNGFKESRKLSTIGENKKKSGSTCLIEAIEQ